ncbi:alpha/beta hydrolase [Paenibacillus lautus]|uniref:alpha/beta fold hydrolase n=1 Tax=Paenibacillus lautus TaxID=1401 RepID=UPI003D27D01E
MDLAYQTQGIGTPVVLVHSPGVDSREWRYIAPHLARSHQVITYDGRGTGKSPAPQKPTSLVEDLRALLDHLEIDSASLVGHSMGGQAVTDFALTYPSRVDHLVLIAPSLTGFEHSQPFIDWMAQVNACAPDVNRLVEQSLSGPNYRVTMSSAERDFLREMHTLYMTRVFSEWKSFEVVWPMPPAIERLEELVARTLFIQGTVEWEDMQRIAEQFKRVQDIRFEVIEGADHMVTLTHAEELAGLILTFLEGTLSSKG